MRVPLRLRSRLKALEEGRREDGGRPGDASPRDLEDYGTTGAAMPENVIDAAAAPRGWQLKLGASYFFD